MVLRLIPFITTFIVQNGRVANLGVPTQHTMHIHINERHPTTASPKSLSILIVVVLQVSKFPASEDKFKRQGVDFF